MLRRNVRVAVASIDRQRRRAIAMSVGVAIGLAVLTLLSSVGETTRRETLARFKRMLGNVDTIIVRPGGQTRGMPSLTSVPPTLRFDDAKAIGALDGVARIAEVQNAFDIDLGRGGASTISSVFGVTPSWGTVRDERVGEGSFITGGDLRTAARVAVLGADIRRALFGNGPAVGQSFRIAEVPFEVRGVLQPRGAGPSGASLDNVVLIPLTTSSQRLFRREYLTMLLVQLRNPDDADRVTAQVRSLLRERHHLPANALDDFGISSPRALMARVTAIGSTLARVLIAVSVLALLIGGAVIAGIMQMAVRERTTEIGVRRAVGASARDVFLQFLAEAALVATAGGVAGLFVGAVGAAAAGGIILWRTVAIGLIVSIAIGIAFGLQPAIAASRVDVIRALRS